MMSQSTICINIIQVEADVHLQGRVISFAAMAIFGMLPLGSLLVGALFHIIGAQNTILCQGVTAILIAALFSKFPRKDQLKKRNEQQLKGAAVITIEKH